MEEIEFSWWLFEGRLRQCKNVLPDGLNWLCYFAGSSKSLRENSISFIFLESSHQVDIKNSVKSSKHFFGYIFQYSRNSQWYLFSCNWHNSHLIFLNKVGTCSSSNGKVPHNKAYRITPQDQMSTSGPA